MSNETTSPHAALKELYFQDWRETDKPWERWQVLLASGFWVGCIEHPGWSVEYEYRRKPDTITVNGITVNAPLRVAPPLGTEYWTVSADEGVIWSTWDDDEIDKNRLKNGCACATQEDAEALWVAVTAPLRAYVGSGK